MKIIVDMLESDYEVIINHCDDYVKSLYNEPEERCILAVKNGTVLPDQARVIDMNKLAITPIDITDLPYDKCLMVYYPEDLDEATILLEAREDGE